MPVNHQWGMLSLAYLALSGCTLLSPYQAEKSLPALPDTWEGQTIIQPAQPNWLDGFAQPELKHLVTMALQKNPELLAAAARIEAARANVTISGADRLPQVAAALDASRGRANTTVSGNLAPITRNNFQAGLNLSWDADLWQRLSHQARAAVLELEASQADYHAAQQRIAANLASQWFNAQEAAGQLQLAKETLNNFESSEAIVYDNYKAGLNTALDVRLARSNSATARSQVALRKRTLDSQLRTLATLIGEYPSASRRLDSNLTDISDEVPAGIPAELVGRRPDIIAAEQRLLATSERVRLARKNRLPQIRLTASGGRSSEELKELLDGDRLVWNLAAGLTAPIFQGGRLKAQEQLALANSDVAIHQYTQTVLTALREVETALASAPLLAEQQGALATAVIEAEESELLAGEQYRAGLVDFITWLEAQRQLASARSSLLQLRNQRLQNRIELHRALGGSFSTNLLSAPGETVSGTMENPATP